MKRLYLLPILPLLLLSTAAFACGHGEGHHPCRPECAAPPGADCRGPGPGPGIAPPSECAPMPGMLPPGPGGPPDERLLDRLDLSDDTRARIDEIRTEADNRTAKMHEQLADEVDRLQELMDADDADRDEVLTQAARVEDLRKEAHLIRLEAILQVRALLTPEERDQLDAMRAELRSRFCGPKGPGPAGRPFDRCPDHGDHHRHGHHGGL